MAMLVLLLLALGAFLLSFALGFVSCKLLLKVV